MNIGLGNIPAESDERLVSLAKAGDTASFGKLVDRHKEKAVRLAYAYVRNYEDAKDAAQEAFVKAYHALGRFDGKSKFYTWLFRIVVNAAIDFSRKKRETTSHDDSIFENIADPHAAVPDISNGHERGAALEQALRLLTEQQHMVISLTYFEELSTAETAEVLGVSEGTIKATRFQALAKMKKWLHEKQGELR